MECNDHISLSAAAALCPGRPSANALWRWARRGIKSRGGGCIKLNHVRVGGKLFTSAEALHKFFADVAAADAAYFDAPVADAIQPPSPSTRQVAHDVAAARSELAAEGFYTDVAGITAAAEGGRP